MIDCVQFTRGLCPAVSIKNIMDLCRQSMIRHTLISGVTCAEAKNEAVMIARRNNTDLLLVEDDVLATKTHFDLIEANRDKVCFAPAKLKSGKKNTTYKPDGSVWYSGTVFLYIPAKVLRAWKGDVFIPSNFAIRDGVLEYAGPNKEGKHSDVHFWHHLRETEKFHSIIELWEVEHLIHDLQNGYKSPCSIKEGLK